MRRKLGACFIVWVDSKKYENGEMETEIQLFKYQERQTERDKSTETDKKQARSQTENKHTERDRGRY